MLESSDYQLLARIACSDRDAFAALYDRHSPKVFALLTRLLRDRKDAEDVLQETFWQIWNGAHQYDAERSRPLVWVLLIARSRAVDHIRRRRRDGVRAELVEPATMCDPSASLQEREAAQMAHSALDCLPADQRQVIGLSFYDGLTHEQISRKQGIPLGTVKTRIRLGMRRLREILEDRKQEASA